AAGECLELVGSGCAEPDRTADATDRHFLAAAGDGFVIERDQDRWTGPVERVQKRADRPFASEPRAEASGPAVPLRFVDMAQPGRRVERRETAEERRRIRAEDSGPVAGNRNVWQAGAAPSVHHRPPAQLRLIPVMRQ